MKIEHFGGAVEVDSANELDDVLRIRTGQNANEFWLSHDVRYPAVAIMVRDALACVHYFPADGHPGFISLATTGSVPESVFTFFVNSPAEETEVSSEYVVSFERARQAAQEFMRATTLPHTIDWLEL